MPRTTIQTEAAPGPYAQTGRELFLVAGDAGNGNAFRMVNDDPLLIVAYNAGASPATVTVKSWLDRFQRYRDAVQVIGAGEHVVLGPFVEHGWRQADNNVYVDVTSADIQMAALYVSQARIQYERVRDDLMVDSQVVLVSAFGTAMMWR